MPEPFRDIHRIWALKEIVLAATDKCKILCEKDDVVVSKQLMLTLMLIVSEATEKILHLQWTDAEGLQHGVEIYSQAIENL